MKTALFYDTETSGLPLFEQPSEHPDQPHIVQLGALLVDLDTKAELASIDMIVRPDGWTIPEEIAAIHGITQEMAMDVGVPEAEAVDALIALWDHGTVDRIAHNESFDARILRIAIKRHIDPREVLRLPVSDVWKAARAQCTARMATPIMKLPPTAKMKAARRFHHKTPNLREAYQHFTGQPLDGAHNAMVDVRACVAIYLAMTAAAPAAVPA